jgi:hypothetical protein
MPRTAILFTGRVCPEMFHMLIEQTRNIEFKYASIWENEDPEYISILTNNNFIVIKNDIKQMELYNPQFVTIVNGLNYLKEQGFDYVLKTRFDILSLSYNKYINIIQDSHLLTVIAGIQLEFTFFIDIIIFGKIDEMCRFYKLQEINDKQQPETFLIENYSGKTKLTKDDLKKIFNFSLTKCIDNNIEFVWFRPNTWANPFRTIPFMRVINEFCIDKEIIWE